MSAKKVYILILNWNGWQDTIGCLRSVLKSSWQNFQVIVCDNASTDGSEQKIIEWLRGESIAFIKYDREVAEGGGLAQEEAEGSLVLIQSGGNLGYAGGNNVALRYLLARGDAEYVWLLNNDTVVDKDALAELVKLAETDETVGMVGSKVLYYDRPDILQSAGGSRIVPWMGNASVIANNQKDDGRWDKPFELDSLNGASFLVKTEVIKAIGLMDQMYFLYWEDADWCVRAGRKGYRLLYCPDSRLWHKEGASTGYMSSHADYYWVRNGLYFIKKFYPYYLPLIPFSYLAKYTIVRAIKKQPFNFKAFTRGFIDFLKGKSGPMQG